MRILGGADLRVKRIIFGANAAAVNLINPRDRYADIAQPGDVKVPRLSSLLRIINTSRIPKSTGLSAIAPLKLTAVTSQRRMRSRRLPRPLLVPPPRRGIVFLSAISVRSDDVRRIPAGTARPFRNRSNVISR